MKTYSEVLEYLYARLPIFQRVGAIAYKGGLDNIIKLCNALGNPQQKFPAIHIAGTNGKGSTSHYLASVLQSAGYKNVGLHTSPHLKDFRERIKINGIPMPEKDVVDFVNANKGLVEKMDCSFFEVSVAMTFWYFAKGKCDIAVIETGLGGRLDSTNIVNPIVSVITNISYDHVALLGDTLPKIAAEKAGIIKPGKQVVIGETQEETKEVFEQKAKEDNSPIRFADSIYNVVNAHTVVKNNKPYLVLDISKNGKPYLIELQSELNGLYQQKNICTVLATIDVLNESDYKISEENILDGISKVVTQTGLLGRWQTLSTNPLTIADTGHNEAGIKEVINQLAKIKYGKLHFVFGMVNDKEPDKVLKLLPTNALYYFCKANIPRALNENELAVIAGKYGLNGDCFTTVKEALQAAQNNAAKDDVVFVGGSTFIVADAL
ncbi:MAG TPA: folylpolyglutamate synthase/dihydrofolate synthase family protein [Bacteroidia bacterium]|jgi:dihydrofolate synthase/folylpolyglutamate synthase|nr:folylpolyglutamate synthase/dihydrofolate synthase family protein [Bacteroidia bacterium]